MPVIKQKMIYREDLKNNRDKLFLFGDNDLRIGMGGQAGQMRNEPNAVGVRTKKAPGMGPNDFFTDNELLKNKMSIIQDTVRVIDHLTKGGVVVIPEDGLGTGLSQLPERAPLTNAYLVEVLAAMETH